MATEIISEKRCPRCRETKPRSEFHRNRAQRDGLTPRCKPCWGVAVRVKQRAKAAANRARRNAEANAGLSPEDLAAEVWRAIPGFESYYEASSLGRIRSIRTAGKGSRWSVLRPHFSRRGGRWRISLKVEQRTTQGTVAKFVALAFLGPRPPGMDVDHIDQCKTNDSARNLRYASRRDNIRAAVAAGIMGSQGARHWKTTLSDDDVRELRRRYTAGETQYALAAAYGITQPGVSLVVRGKTRKHA